MNRWLENETKLTSIFAGISAVSLLLSITGVLKNILPVDIAWIAIILCGVPILVGAVKGVIFEHDIKADVLVAMALVASVVTGEFFAAGETIPVDGIITEGETTIDLSVMTGESIPVDKKAGDMVSSGTINQFGTFVMKAERESGHSTGCILSLCLYSGNTDGCSCRYRKCFKVRNDHTVRRCAGETFKDKEDPISFRKKRWRSSKDMQAVMNRSV